ncbi:hypothetical protein VTK73DRAFT_5061 [Phialemonium thermophilum]|uniref:alcohol dehydrogenase n=1 Tax=Phialemonium thermophilum TaxID=223376 RepID=A0ABR3WQD9_9PEZI
MGSTETFKGAVLVEHGERPVFEIRDLPRPKPGPLEVLIRLNVSSICGTDCGQAQGHLGPTLPIIGHEGVGRIAELGSSVQLVDPTVEIGQRVGVGWNRDACGSCAYCTNLHEEGETRCEGLFQSGRKMDGTFAEYTVVPLRYLMRIPAEYDSVPDEHVAPIVCGGVTAYRAVKTLELTPGRWVAVSGGGGGVGAFAVAFARAMGYRVIAVDFGAAKGEYARAQGAEHYVDLAKDPNAGLQVKALTGGLGASAVIVTVGNAAAYQAAFDMLGPFGKYMCVGVPPIEQVVTFHPLLFIGNGFKMLGSAVGTRKDTLDALEFVKRGVVAPKVEWGKLENLAELIVDVAKGKIQGKYVVRLDNLT